jgi:hypothetical protein
MIGNIALIMSLLGNLQENFDKNLSPCGLQNFQLWVVLSVTLYYSIVGKSISRN